MKWWFKLDPRNTPFTMNSSVSRVPTGSRISVFLQNSGEVLKPPELAPNFTAFSQKVWRFTKSILVNYIDIVKGFWRAPYKALHLCFNWLSFCWDQMALDVQITSIKNFTNLSRDYELSMELSTLWYGSHIYVRKNLTRFWDLKALVWHENVTLKFDYRNM